MVNGGKGFGVFESSENGPKTREECVERLCCVGDVARCFDYRHSEQAVGKKIVRGYFLVL